MTIASPFWLARQVTTPSPLPPADADTGGPPVSLIIVLSVVVLLAATTFLLVLARLLVSRRAARSAARDGLTSTARPNPDAEHVLFAYFPPQAPSVVRMQRLAQSAGLSLHELSDVAPVISFQKREGGEEENTCAVCLEEMHADSKARRMPCGHDFDAKCIEEWASKANRCPVCNMHIVDEDILQKNRLDTLEGRETSSPSPNGPRQRRRRTRGENGTFQLRPNPPSSEVPNESVTPTPAPAPPEPPAPLENLLLMSTPTGLQ